MKKNYLLKLTFIAVFFATFMSCKTEECDCSHEKCQQKMSKDTFYYSDEGRTKEMLDYNEVVAMLRDYDTTRIAPLEKALGYADSRINTYDFKQFKKYLGRIENLSKKANIKITGISFISAAKPNYDGTGKSYQDLIYIPTTTVNGKQVQFDPVQSLSQKKLVTFKQMLAKNGYNWIYNTKSDFEKGKREDNNYYTKKVVENKAGLGVLSVQSSELSGAGNWGSLTPPHNGN